MKKVYLIALAVACIPDLFAGGSQVNLQGQKQQGMGHVGTAFTLGAENVFFNPGSMSFLSRKTMFSLGINGIASSVIFQPYNETQQFKTEQGLGTPFNIFATHKFSKRLSGGLGVYIPFGSTVLWEPEWKGRYILQKVELTTVYIQPTVSYKIGDNFGIGFGGVIGLGSVVLEKDLPIASTSGARSYVSLEGNDVAYGFNFGMYYEWNEKLSFGYSYRSSMQFGVNGGEANFFTPSSLADRFPAKNFFDASVPLPATNSFGIAYKPTSKLSFGLDLNFVQWGIYDRLKIDLKENTEALEDVDDTKDYSDVFIFRGGMSYQVSERYTQRFGAYFDKSPVSASYWGPETPDMDKLGLTTGGSLLIGANGSIDFSYILLMGAERQVENVETGLAGQAKGIGHIFGIGYSHNF